MNDGLRRFATGVMAIAVMSFVGCNDSTPATNASTEAAKPVVAAKPVPVTAKSVISPMLTAAVNWAPDAQLIRMTAKEIPGFKSGQGKASLWEASFGSPQLRRFQVYTDAITTVLPEYHKGVEAGRAQAWAGISPNEQPIDIASVTVDSDAAYAAAAADAAEWTKKNSDKTQVAIELGKVAKFSNPVWYVKFGDNKIGYIAVVDASTGKVIKK